MKIFCLPNRSRKCADNKTLRINLLFRTFGKEGDGFVLLYKRLDKHVGRYQWPRNKNEVKPISWRQFDWLMSGLEIEQPKAIQRRLPGLRSAEKP